MSCLVWVSCLLSPLKALSGFLPYPYLVSLDFLIFLFHNLSTHRYHSIWLCLHSLLLLKRKPLTLKKSASGQLYKTHSPHSYINPDAGRFLSKIRLKHEPQQTHFVSRQQTVIFSVQEFFSPKNKRPEIPVRKFENCRIYPTETSGTTISIHRSG